MAVFHPRFAVLTVNGFHNITAGVGKFKTASFHKCAKVLMRAHLHDMTMMLDRFA